MLHFCYEKKFNQKYAASEYPFVLTNPSQLKFSTLIALSSQYAMTRNYKGLSIGLVKTQN